MVLKNTNIYQFCGVVHVTANIGITEEASTGVAPIAVDDSGKLYARFYLRSRIERIHIEILQCCM